MNLHKEIYQMGEQALAAARRLATLTARKKNIILEAMAAELDARRADILAANARDLAAGKEAGLSAALLDRLTLSEARIDAMIKGVADVAALKDPVGTRLSTWLRPNGLQISKVRVPIGVIAIIYESRPNVTVDSAVLCFKAGNAVILRGGKEAKHSNLALARALAAGGEKKGMPAHAVQLVEVTTREAVREIVQLEGLVDMVIPRGGEGLIRAVAEMARVPVLKHYKGVCHTYVDAKADLDMALKIAVNAKVQRPGVCNAMETLLVHEAVAEAFLPRALAALREKGVEIRGDERVCGLDPEAEPASAEDWAEEYLDLVLSVRVVEDVTAAVEHINHFGSHHSDAIVTADEDAAEAFTEGVDSATVYVNASTRFTDGAEFGMGAEIGISTDKLHARGPMGLEELTTYKYIIQGEGQIRE